jgi:hypothetical protein
LAAFAAVFRNEICNCPFRQTARVNHPDRQSIQALILISVARLAAD